MRKTKLGKSRSRYRQEQNTAFEPLCSATTPKPNCPLRIIVSESGTWQNALAGFLEAKLNILTIYDPFRIESSDNVIDALVGLPSKKILGYCVYIKDLYYSIPQDELLSCVDDTIDKHDVVAF